MVVSPDNTPRIVALFTLGWTVRLLLSVKLMILAV